MTEAAPNYVFVSYASADRERVFAIVRRLEALGVRVWIDRERIEGGSNYGPRIVEGVRGAAALVLMCSASAFASRNVKQEIQLAWKYGRPYLPLLLDRTPVPSELEYWLEGWQWVEILDARETLWAPQVSRALQSLGLVSTAPTVEEVQASSAAVLQAPGAGPGRAPRPVAPLSPLARLRRRAQLIGRSEELAFLTGEFDAAARGAGSRLVLIGGEPGVGKTRLAEEVGSYAGRANARILRGGYRREGDSPYGPWIDILRSGLEGLSPAEIDAVVGPYRADIGRILPEVARDEVPGAPALSAAEMQRRLYDSIVQVIAALARRTPLVLIVDDLQWAPDLSLGLHLATQLRAAPVLGIVTYRDEEMRLRGDLTGPLADLKRLGNVFALTLDRLSGAETAQLIQSYLGDAPARELRGPVFHGTEGNPFFVEEVLRSLAETGAVRISPEGWEVVNVDHIAIPASMRQVVEERVDHVDPAARQVLTQAAVLGPEFSLAVLERMGDETEDVLLDVLDRAVSARLLDDRSAGEEVFAFHDDQVQEVLYQGLTPLRRRRLHLRAGQAVEEVYSGRLDGHLDELARHFAKGGDAGKTADYAFRAGERNEQLFTWARAAAWYAQAADALSRLPDSAENRAREVDALVRQVSLSFASASSEDNLAILGRAEELARSLSGPDGAADGDQRRLARIHYWMGYSHGMRGENREAIEYYQKVLEVAPGLGDPELIAIPSSTIGEALSQMGQFAQAEPFLNDALAPLEQVANWHEWVFCLGSLGWVKATRGLYAEGISDIRAALAKATQLNNPVDVGTSNLLLSLAALEGRDARLALTAGQEGRDILLETGNGLFACMGMAFVGLAESRLGNHEAAGEELERMWATSAQFNNMLIIGDVLTAFAAEVALNAGDLPRAIELVHQTNARADEVGALFGKGLAHRVWAHALYRGAAGSPGDGMPWPEIGEHFVTSAANLEAGDARLELAATHLAWGELLVAHDVESACDHLTRAADGFAAAGIQSMEDQARRLLARAGGASSATV